MDAGDWISVAATLIAAASFVWGVVAWRTSYLGQKKIELAEQVYELFLTCADHISAIRSPFGYVGEGASRQRAANETDEETEIYNRAYVAIERIEQRRDDFNKLFSLMPRFEFYFGAKAAAPIKAVGDVLHEIRAASNMLRVHWLQQGRPFPNPEAFNRHLERMNRYEAVFWDGSEDDDPISPRISGAVTSIKSTCTSVLNPQPNLWRGMRGGLLAFQKFFEIPEDLNSGDPR
ncbi:hypothetical protein SD208_11335 [Ochrobactrum sp. BD67]